MKPTKIVIHSHAEKIKSNDKTYDPFEWQNHLGNSFHKAYYHDGTVKDFIPNNKVAYHAGISRWEENGQVLTGFNQFSLGYEIIIKDAYDWTSFKSQIKLRSSFTDEMYNSLSLQCAKDCIQHQMNPVKDIVLHSWISGKHVRETNYKIDPGAGFDYIRLVSMTRQHILRLDKKYFDAIT